LKKAILGAISLVMVLAITLPIANVAMAQSETDAEVALSVRPALALEAPESAKVGQQVVIRVVVRQTGQPVSRAGVWAIDVNNITDEAITAEDYASLAETHGYFLGWTDRHGKVVHCFSEPGHYVLVAIKAGFIPGIAKITIEPKPSKALEVRAPRVAGVWQLVTINVVREHNGKPVPNAEVWAVHVRDITNETDDALDYASLARKCGYFLGHTDEDGNVFHRFRRPGRYVLVALKPGFTPGFAKIAIRGLQQAEAEPLPAPVPGQTVLRSSQ